MLNAFILHTLSSEGVSFFWRATLGKILEKDNLGVVWDCRARIARSRWMDIRTTPLDSYGGLSHSQYEKSPFWIRSTVGNVGVILQKYKEQKMGRKFAIIFSYLLVHKGPAFYYSNRL